ncbi:MAG: hypothetical protein WAX14_11760 [Rhodococcus sp. (in: high G+C Gram-positive bacteria)]|uniref:hypothetical protein n=1 Tax=Rhodococcus sp. TaxID=1831 RepID=UPI003BB54884
MNLEMRTLPDAGASTALLGEAIGSLASALDLLLTVGQTGYDVHNAKTRRILGIPYELGPRPTSTRANRKRRA